MSAPEDVPGQCNARLYIGDDHGDNHATMRCGEEPSHLPPHRERYERSDGGQHVEITWTQDERNTCDECKGKFDEVVYCENCQRDLCTECFKMEDYCSGCSQTICGKCWPTHKCPHTCDGNDCHACEYGEK